MAKITLHGQPVTRRTMLRGLIGGSVVSIGLPPLEMFFNGNGTAYACTGSLPRRFGVFFWGNGNHPERFVPSSTGEGDAWQVSEQLTPLANIKHKLSVISGMSVKIPNSYPHTSGKVGLLSGAQPLVSGTDVTYKLPTIDQLIADEIGGYTLYKSLQTTATSAAGESYTGPNARNPPEASPYTFFDRIFGASFRQPGDSAAVDPTWGLRRSILDVVMDDMSTLRGRVGVADQTRLDQHLEGIRELEQRLAMLEEDPPDLAACALPTAPLSSYPDIDGRPQFSAVSRAMCDLLCMALACDQTRVFGHYFSDPVSDVLYTGTSAGHHDLTHNETGDQPEVHSITLQIMAEFAYLLEKMESIDEGDGTLLDNSIVLGTSEVSFGQTHSLEDMPILIGGTGCGVLKTNYHYRSYTGDSASKVMYTLLRAMDVSVSSFGDDEGYVTDGLSELEV